MPNNAYKSIEDIYNDKCRSVSNRTTQEQSTMQRVNDAVLGFLFDTKLLMTPRQKGDREYTAGLASYSLEDNFDQVTNSAIDTLLADAQIPKRFHSTATSAVLALLVRVKNAANNGTYTNNHFSSSARANQEAVHKQNASMIYPESLLGEVMTQGMPGNAAFGAEVDKVLPDVQKALFVTLMQFHRGILDRTVHRRITPVPYVSYQLGYVEVYDLMKSNSRSAEERNYGDHIVPFIKLYNDPSPVSNALTPIKPLVANDVNGVLLQDGVIKPNVSVNLFDLAGVAGTLGYTNVNYTDLVAEAPSLDSVIITLSSGTGESAVSEQFQIAVGQFNGSRLMMTVNTNDSGDRSNRLDQVVRFDSQTKTITGETSTLLASCTGADVITIQMIVSAAINLKTADFHCMGNILASARNSAGGVVSEALSTLVAGMTVTFDGVTVDARYSEENVRKSNLALRNHVHMREYAINNSRNVIIDFSMNETSPDDMMPTVMEGISIGADHRALEIATTVMSHVYDQGRQEALDPTFRRRTTRLITEYPCGQRVFPTVKMGVLDMRNVNTLRDSDTLGDIRARVERYLLNVFSSLFQDSLYRQQLNGNEKPMFKVITSAVILDNLFNIPHIHNHLNTHHAVDGENVEFRYVLSNGVILDVVTTNFTYMRNRIYAIPYREGMPEDTLNFGQNCDAGAFVSMYNPQNDNGVNKRIFANSRTMLLPTNPSGVILEVPYISDLRNMYEFTTLAPSVVPAPYTEPAEDESASA